MDELIDLKSMNKAEVLAKLYNASHPQGNGYLHPKAKRFWGFFRDRDPDQSMSVQEAQVLLDKGQTYFDYLNGRVLKIDLSGDTLSPRLYNRDNGMNQAARVLGLM